MRRKALTLVEMMVAIGLLAIVMVMAGSIFRVAIESYRMAKANGEILQKLRVITSQLDRDLQGLIQQDQAFTVCLGQKDPNAPKSHGRFDRIVFLASGDFDSYRPVELRNGDPSKPVSGNTARISYMLARRYDPVRDRYIQAIDLPPSRRILARTQHILTPEEFKDPCDPCALGTDISLWFKWHNHQEYDQMTLRQSAELFWARLPDPVRVNALTAITDIDVDISGVKSTLVSNDPPYERGACVDLNDPNSIHMILCEGVGDFAIQGWDDTAQQWVPQTDSSGALAQKSYLGLPAQGRALKFTFTLYDSKGVLKTGRTFTHIVDLDH
jgi:prepilin-type N-terminal cleavage/methylation domain-containing protein